MQVYSLAGGSWWSLHTIDTLIRFEACHNAGGDDSTLKGAFSQSTPAKDALGSRTAVAAGPLRRDNGERQRGQEKNEQQDDASHGGSCHCCELEGSRVGAERAWHWALFIVNWRRSTLLV
jgi:hypothetical protein